MNNFIDSFIKNISKAPITAFFILINTIMAIMVLIYGGFNADNLDALGGLVPSYVIDNHEYYRIITAMFLHANILHFLVNMYALYYLGRNLEFVLGPLKFVLLSLLGGIGSGIAVVLFVNSNTMTVGASGMIFAIVGGLLLLTFVRKQWFHPQSIRSIRMLVIINIVITFTIPYISIAGHLGGLVMGVILMLLMTPKIPYYVLHR